jgi:hypothetical protein
MTHDYNSTRRKLVLPEYGRNIQKMVNHIKTIEDREERNKAAKTLISIMQNMVPHGKDLNELKHKLWDHLAIISDFELDIDSPFELPDKEKLQTKPKPVSYKSNPIKFKHYGRSIELMIKKAVEMEEGETKDRLIKLIANHMKRSYLAWNKSQVTDEVIFKDIKILSQGKLEIKEGLVLTDTRQLLSKPRKKRSNLQKSNIQKKKN